MGENKIDDRKLNRLLRSGKSQREVARILGVSDSAVTQAKRRLNIAVVKDVGLESAHRVVEENLDAIGQLRRINNTANGLLDAATKAEDHETVLKCMAEIRGQLRLQLDIFAVLYDVKEIQAFQQEVLSLLEEVEPGARERIVSRLKEGRVIRASLSID